MATTSDLPRTPRTPRTPRIPVIVGPTAGGKTGLAVEVALEFEKRGLGNTHREYNSCVSTSPERKLGITKGRFSQAKRSCARAQGSSRRMESTPKPDKGGGRAEIISADAFQVYRSMDIGTGKATADEQRGVVHHLLDVLEPDDSEPFTVARWLEMAERAIEDIRGRGNLPIVVGGTHLYIKSFLEGMFEGPGADEGLREELRGLKPAALRAELERVDPAAAARIHPNDQRRTIRAIEVFRVTGRPISEHQAQWDRDDRVRTDAILVGLDWAAEAINPRINARVKAMVEAGFVDEVRGLLGGNVRGGRLGEQAREALGYKQLAAWIEAGEGAETLAETIERIKIETRRFAKNQRTWLRRLKAIPGSIWLQPGNMGTDEMVQVVVNQALAP